MSARSYRRTQHFGEKTTDRLKQAGVSCKLESKVCICWKNKADGKSLEGGGGLGVRAPGASPGGLGSRKVASERLEGTLSSETPGPKSSQDNSKTGSQANSEMQLGGCPG